MEKFVQHLRIGFNKVIIVLTTSDILVWGTYSVAIPIIGLYLADRFGENIVEYIGMGLAVFYFTRGLVQLPIGILTDRIKRDVDEIMLLMIGCVMMSIPFFLYPIITEPWQYISLQVLNGAGASLNLNSWRKLFAKNLSKGHEGMNYGFYEMIMSFGTAILSLAAGLIANVSKELFSYVLLSVGMFQITGGVVAGLVYFIRNRKSFKV